MKRRYSFLRNFKFESSLIVKFFEDAAPINNGELKKTI